MLRRKSHRRGLPRAPAAPDHPVRAGHRRLPRWEALVSKALAIAAGSTVLAFVVLDAIWLSTMTGAVYRPRLGPLLLDRPVIWAAVLFYLLYAAGMTLFVVQPALAAGSAATALWLGLALGLVAYGTYDLTNQATIRGWPPLVTFVDMAWGSVATGVSAALGVWLGLRFAG